MRKKTKRCKYILIIHREFVFVFLWWSQKLNWARNRLCKNIRRPRRKKSLRRNEWNNLIIRQPSTIIDLCLSVVLKYVCSGLSFEKSKSTDRTENMLRNSLAKSSHRRIPNPWKCWQFIFINTSDEKIRI